MVWQMLFRSTVRTTGSISDSFPVLFTPAGYVFSIWGVIYLGLIAFGIFQALPSQRDNPRLLRVGPWFAIGNLFNASWIILWHYGYFTLTLVAMLGLLVALLFIFQRLVIAKRPDNARELWLVNIPFSIYLGWISVATIANFSASLYNLGFTGGPLSQEIWTVAPDSCGHDPRPDYDLAAAPGRISPGPGMGVYRHRGKTIYQPAGIHCLRCRCNTDRHCHYRKSDLPLFRSDGNKNASRVA